MARYNPTLEDNSSLSNFKQNLERYDMPSLANIDALRKYHSNIASDSFNTTYANVLLKKINDLSMENKDGNKLKSPSLQHITFPTLYVDINIDDAARRQASQAQADKIKKGIVNVDQDAEKTEEQFAAEEQENIIKMEQFNQLLNLPPKPASFDKPDSEKSISEKVQSAEYIALRNEKIKLFQLSREQITNKLAEESRQSQIKKALKDLTFEQLYLLQNYGELKTEEIQNIVKCYSHDYEANKRLTKFAKYAKIAIARDNKARGKLIESDITDILADLDERELRMFPNRLPEDIKCLISGIDNNLLKAAEKFARQKIGADFINSNVITSSGALSIATQAGISETEFNSLLNDISSEGLTREIYLKKCINAINKILESDQSAKVINISWGGGNLLSNSKKVRYAQQETIKRVIQFIQEKVISIEERRRIIEAIEDINDRIRVEQGLKGIMYVPYQNVQPVTVDFIIQEIEKGESPSRFGYQGSTIDEKKRIEDAISKNIPRSQRFTVNFKNQYNSEQGLVIRCIEFDSPKEALIFATIVQHNLPNCNFIKEYGGKGFVLNFPKGLEMEARVTLYKILEEMRKQVSSDELPRRLYIGKAEPAKQITGTLMGAAGRKTLEINQEILDANDMITYIKSRFTTYSKGYLSLSPSNRSSDMGNPLTMKYMGCTDQESEEVLLKLQNGFERSGFNKCEISSVPGVANSYLLTIKVLNKTAEEILEIIHKVPEIRNLTVIDREDFRKASKDSEPTMEQIESRQATYNLAYEVASNFNEERVIETLKKQMEESTSITSSTLKKRSFELS